MSSISGHGIAVEARGGWDVRIAKRPPQAPETTYATLHAATFALPASFGDYGDGAVELMSPNDVFVALVEFDPAATATALFSARGFPAPLTGGDIRRGGVQRALGEMAGVQRFFSAAGRAWCLYVVVGSFRARERLVRRANQLVAGIRV
ncbi:MAG: hypothetical protein ACYDH6_24025 [Acidimicrobiales bacterium]